MALKIVTDGDDKSPKKDPVQSIAPDTKKEKGELSEVLGEWAKKKGDGFVKTASKIPPIKRIPSGIAEVDINLGGGIPVGRISIISGPEGSGKSNLAMTFAGSVQRRKTCNKVVWIDAEQVFDGAWAANFLDTDSLYVVNPHYGEEAADMVDSVIHADDVGLIVVDSLAALISTKEVEKSMEIAEMAGSSIMIRRMTHKILASFATEAARGHYPTVLFINQIRVKVGQMFGNPETEPGGNAPRFACSLWLRVSAKNEVVKQVSSVKPSFKDTSVVVKKSKVPVNAYELSYRMCLLPHDNLKIGETDSFYYVKGVLQNEEILTKVKDGYRLFDKTWPTIGQIREAYIADIDLRIKMQQAAANTFDGKGFMIEPEKPIPNQPKK